MVTEPDEGSALTEELVHTAPKVIIYFNSDSQSSGSLTDGREWLLSAFNSLASHLCLATLFLVDSAETKEQIGTKLQISLQPLLVFSPPSAVRYMY